MDRLNKVHRAARVDLPAAILIFDDVGALPPRNRRPLPLIPRYIGISAFLTCGVAVIAMAGFLALSIQ